MTLGDADEGDQSLHVSAKASRSRKCAGLEGSTLFRRSWLHDRQRFRSPLYHRIFRVFRGRETRADVAALVAFSAHPPAVRIPSTPIENHQPLHHRPSSVASDVGCRAHRWLRRAACGGRGKSDRGEQRARVAARQVRVVHQAVAGIVFGAVTLVIHPCTAIIALRPSSMGIVHSPSCVMRRFGCACRSWAGTARGDSWRRRGRPGRRPQHPRRGRDGNPS